ncbi:F-box-like domain protein, putative [Rhizoctonia solani AG-3 Rhs1AP]|uniref:F-box-like domain protein, putative n=1 Tax=Rhizoctonia solani AG-3 Rhs1AP TaxID=1086054 RepID=X8J7I7_9AGAM|nr:F-box-like domain protein, putative [Rhizoctonia solani AG-3 Rhs1AP]
MEELMASCDFLDSALERYYNACVALELKVYHNFAQADLHGALLGSLAEKLTKSAAHKKKLKRCEMTLRRVRNHSSSVVPVNALPPEVLTRIFVMLRSCCFEGRKSSKLAVPIYPDTLAQVCSRWRRIAIGSSALWSHIDLSPSSDKDISQRLLSRAKAFHTRSNELPLDIHVIGSGGDAESVAKFCTPIARRIRSLVTFSPSTESLTPVLNSCFLHCVPGTLNHIAIWGEYDKYSYFWSASANGYLDSFTTWTGTDRRRVDELLLGIQVLDLTTNCIPPTSSAYRGLAELRLMGPGMRLTETHFLGILAASPKLRILHLDIDIGDASQSPSKVQLRELEVLFLSWVEDRENLVRLLHPGTQPLKLILEARNRLSMARSTAAAFKSLFERSAVTELYIHHVLGTPGCGQVLFNPFQLLEVMPHIRVLALSGVDIKHLGQRPTHKSSISSSVKSTPSLHTLHLISSPIEWISFVDLIETYDVQKTTIWDSTLYTEKRTNRMQDDQKLIRDILTDVCPTVQILGDGFLELAGVRDEK